MRTYESVGFTKTKAIAQEEVKGETADGKEERAGEGGEVDENIIDSIPKQVKQYFVPIPTQYRLLYLLAFLYAH